MTKNSSKTIEAEKAFAADVYRDRAAINRKAQAVLASGSRQITIGLGNDPRTCKALLFSVLDFLARRLKW